MINTNKKSIRFGRVLINAVVYKCSYFCHEKSVLTKNAFKPLKNLIIIAFQLNIQRQYVVH